MCINIHMDLKFKMSSTNMRKRAGSSRRDMRKKFVVSRGSRLYVVSNVSNVVHTHEKTRGFVAPQRAAEARFVFSRGSRLNVVSIVMNVYC